MIFILFLLISITSAATQKTYRDVYKTVMKENNGRVTYDGESAVLVLFYFSKDQNMTQPSFAQPFIVPNYEMTKLKINNFYDLMKSMKEGLKLENITLNVDNIENIKTNEKKEKKEKAQRKKDELDDLIEDLITDLSKTGKELYCRLLVNYKYSDPIKVVELIQDETTKQYEARFPKFISVRTELGDDSRIQTVAWDHDQCETCNKNNAKECFDNYCTFGELHFGETTCAEAQKNDKTACGLIIYFGWKGPAHAGFTTQYLKSYRNLPTHYTKYSKGNQFSNAAADIKGDWFSF